MKLLILLYLFLAILHSETHAMDLRQQIRQKIRQFNLKQTTGHQKPPQGTYTGCEGHCSVTLSPTPKDWSRNPYRATEYEEYREYMDERLN
jgi:hypothetical protein